MKVCATQEGRPRWVPREWTRSPSPRARTGVSAAQNVELGYRPLRPEGRPRIGTQTAQATTRPLTEIIQTPQLIDNNDTNLSLVKPNSRLRPDTPRWAKKSHKIRKSAHRSDTADPSYWRSILPESKDDYSLSSIYREAGYTSDWDERWPLSPPPEEGSREIIRGRHNRLSNRKKRRFQNQMIVLTRAQLRHSKRESSCTRKNVRTRIKKERRRRVALGTLAVPDECTLARPLTRHKSHLLIEIESDSDDEFSSYYYTYPSFISAVRRYWRTASYRLRSLFSQGQDQILSWIAQFFGSQGTWTTNSSTPVFCCGLQKTLSNTELGRLFSLLYATDDDAAVLGTKAVSTQDVNVAIEQSSSLLYGELLRAGVEKLLNADHLNLRDGGLFLDLGSGLGKVGIQAICQRRADVLAVELGTERARIQAQAVNRLWKLSLDSSLLCWHADPKRIMYPLVIGTKVPVANAINFSVEVTSLESPSPFDRASLAIMGGWINGSIRNAVMQLTKFVEVLVTPMCSEMAQSDSPSTTLESSSSEDGDSILALTLEYLGCEPVARKKKKMINELREWLTIQPKTKAITIEELPLSQTVPSISVQFGSSDNDPFRRRITVANGNLFSVPINWLKRATAVLLATDFPSDKEEAVGDLLDQLSIGTRVASYRHIARFYEKRPEGWHKWSRIAAGARFLTSWCPDVGYEFFIWERVAHSSDLAVVPKAIPLRGPICVAIAAEFKAMADLEQRNPAHVIAKKSSRRRFCGCGGAECRRQPKRHIYVLRQRGRRARTTTEEDVRKKMAQLSPRSIASWMMRPTSEFRECAPPRSSVSPYLKPVHLKSSPLLPAREPAWPAFWN